MGIIKVAILATDITFAMLHIKALRDITESGNFSWKNHQHRYKCVCIKGSFLTPRWFIPFHSGRELVYCVLMTACDLCATCKPWEVNRRIVDDLFAEFHQQVGGMCLENLRLQANFFQGDKEKALGAVPVKMMDSNHKDKMPQFQVMKGNQNVVHHELY